MVTRTANVLLYSYCRMQVLILHCTGATGDDILIPGCQFRQGTVSHFCTGQTLQQVFQIFIDIQTMCPGHLNHSVYSCTGLSPLGSIAEQPVFPANCKRMDRILCGLSSYVNNFPYSHDIFILIFSGMRLKICIFSTKDMVLFRILFTSKFIVLPSNSIKPWYQTN